MQGTTPITGAGRDVPLPRGVEQSIARWDAQRIADQKVAQPATSAAITKQTGATR